jgi:hypothetical protein
MSNNMNLGLVALLVIILLYCCLGTINISESLVNSVVHESQEQIGKGGLNNNRLGPGETQQNPTPLPTPTYDPAKAVTKAGKDHAEQEGKEYQNEISGQCSNGMDQYGYCLENNAKNKNSNPGKYNNKKGCDNAGFIWNNALKTCENKLGPGGNYKYESRGECEYAGFIWNSTTNSCEFNYPGKDGGGTLNHCPEGMEWDHKKKMCVHTKKDKCPTGMHWNKNKQKCVHSKKNHCPSGMHWNQHKMMCEHSKKDHCPNGMHWNNKKNKCVKDKSDSESDSSSDDSDWEGNMANDWNQLKSNISNFFNQNQQTGQHQPRNQNAGSYPVHAVKRRHEILPGDENLYILKSEIVPPVCPACPPVIGGGGYPAACKATCAPCPRPPPVPPCPPCERCPEPQFQCKKVPDYKNIIPGNLPRPLLNDFSQFT